MSGETLIVNDEYIVRTAEEIYTGLDGLNTVFDGYLHLLEAMSEQVVQAGATARALEAYREYAGMLKGHLNLIGQNTKWILNNYVLSIDEADQYLF